MPEPTASDSNDHTAHASTRDAWAGRVSAGIAAGSREALAMLYEAKFEMLYAALKQSTRRDESFILDCIQEAMLRVATKLQRMDSHHALDVWLKRVVLNAALDRLRAERSLEERARSAPGRGVDIGDDPSNNIEEELARLPHEDRSLLHLRFARGLTLQQLSEHLGLAPKAIDSRIRRLIARVRGGPAPATEAGKEGNNP